MKILKTSTLIILTLFAVIGCTENESPKYTKTPAGMMCEKDDIKCNSDCCGSGGDVSCMNRKPTCYKPETKGEVRWIH